MSTERHMDKYKKKESRYFKVILTAKEEKATRKPNREKIL